MSTVRLSAAIMTHPARVDAAERLRERCSGFGPQVAIDPSPGRAGNLDASVLAWSSKASAATHHLVLQDDVDLCPGFAEEVVEAVASRPNDPLYLFAEWGTRTGQMARLAALRGVSWAEDADPILSPQAIVMPTQLAGAFVDYVATHPEVPQDDALALGDFLRDRGARTFISVPNLVEHAGAPSLLGHDLLMGWRRSVCFGRPDGDDRHWSSTTLDAGVLLPHLDAGKAYVCDSSDDQWTGEPANAWLAARGMPLAEQIRLYHEAATLTDLADVHRIVSPTVTFHYWLTGFLFGALCGQDDVDSALKRPLVQRAFATLFSGGTRAQLPAARMAELSPHLIPLLEQGIRMGAIIRPA